MVRRLIRLYVRDFGATPLTPHFQKSCINFGTYLSKSVLFILMSSTVLSLVFQNYGDQIVRFKMYEGVLKLFLKPVYVERVIID